jgi:mRNA-degrading endonuclease toxin of MazEF toxin-antitoxin module
LQQRSQVMISRPQSVPRARLGQIIGSVGAATLREVTRRLAALLGIG